jgi:hypothetical protein
MSRSGVTALIIPSRVNWSGCVVASASICARSARLGHASTGITEVVYSHVLESMQEQATDDLERVIFGAK